MTSTESLRQEHALIARVLDGLEEIARRLEADRPIPLVLLEAAVDFLGAFVDGCHQAKEDDVLLPRLAARMPAATDPVDPLGTEHREGTRRFDALRTAVRRGRGRAVPELARALRDYVAFLRTHFAREDAVLFPLVERVLPEAEERLVVEDFERVDRRTLGPDARAALLELGEALLRACRSEAGEPRRRAVARDVMRAVPRLAPEQSLASAALVMEALQVRELPVVAGGRLVGLLADRDLRPHAGHWEWTRVETAMTRDPVTVAPDAAVPEVARLLLAHGFNAVPVVDDGVPLGVVSRADLLRVLTDDGALG
jgi:CBS domain-containing protein